MATKKKNTDKQHSTAIIVAIIGLTGTIIAALLSSPLLEKAFSATPIISLTNTPDSLMPSSSGVVFDPHPDSSDYIDTFGIHMRLVPVGDFIMGVEPNDGYIECQKYHSDCEIDWFSDVSPAHKIFIGGFYIDKYEVTNNLYRLCVDARYCKPPLKYGSASYDDPIYGNYPVEWVDWFMAKQFCEWRGGRLPSEAEWEKAARGTDARTYPWGESFSCSKANANWCTSDVAEIGSYPEGVSPYGVFDMVGNVSEWVNSLYRPYPFDINDNRENPLGSAGKRVQRGGGIAHPPANGASSYARSYSNPDGAGTPIGFRCVIDLAP